MALPLRERARLRAFAPPPSPSQTFADRCSASPPPFCPQRPLSTDLKHDNLQIIYQGSDGKIIEVTAPVGGLYSNNEDENPNGVTTTLPEETKHAPLVIINLCARGAVGTTTHTFAIVKNRAPTPSTAIVLRQQGEELVKYKAVVGKNVDGVLTLKADYIDIVEPPTPSPASVRGMAPPPPARGAAAPAAAAALVGDDDDDDDDASVDPKPVRGGNVLPTSDDRTENGFFTLAYDFIGAQDKKTFLARNALIEVNWVRDGRSRPELSTINLLDLLKSVANGDITISGKKEGAAPCLIDLDKGNVDYPLYSLVRSHNALWLIIGSITDEADVHRGEKPNLLALQMWEVREEKCFSSTGLPLLNEFSSDDLNIEDDDGSTVPNLMPYSTWSSKYAMDDFSSDWLPDSNEETGSEAAGDDDDDDDEEEEPRAAKGRGGAGPSGKRLAAPAARRQKTGASKKAYSRNGDLTKGVKKYEGSKVQLMQLDGWGSMFKIYCAVKSSEAAGIYVCNHDDYDQCTMKFQIKKDTWNKKGYGNYDRDKLVGFLVKEELQQRAIDLGSD